jgi:D-3-phosphoglycerate dehydrogenase
MHVIAYDPVVSRDRFRELGVERAETQDDVYAVAEFLTLHLPLIPETRGSINAEALSKMRDGVRIINAARGALVVDEDLLAALVAGKVAGAALDVFSEEPYTGPLTQLDNVVVTPHLAASTDEAQDRAGVIVAEQVVAALEGGLVTNAVNIPALRAEDLEFLSPYLPLAKQLGRLALEFSDGRADAIGLAYHGGIAGYDTRLLTLAALNGAFESRDPNVNWVNARMIAADRGIEVNEESHRSSRDFTNLVHVSVRQDGEEVGVAGTTIGTRLWLASALGYELEMELAERMVFLRYDDVPGQIGRIGSLFGEAEVNIANMAVSRNREGGKALMALSVDSEVPDTLVAALGSGGFDDVRVVQLG